MQDAFFQEKQAVGTWMEVGYSAPGTGASTSYASNVISYTSDANKGWNASPKTAALNDCDTNEGWHLALTVAADNGSYQIADNGSSSDCTILTGAWSNLTRSSN